MHVFEDYRIFICEFSVIYEVHSCLALEIIKNSEDSGFRIEKGGEAGGAERAKVVQRSLGKVKGRRKKIILILVIAFWWFCKEGRRKRRELRLL